MAQTFERIEKKYWLTRPQHEELQRLFTGRMAQDQYGLHTIGNLYLDTDDWQLVRASNEKPVYKEKLRLRSYGTPGADSPVFLEIKKKLHGVVYKRRAQMTQREAMRYLSSGVRPGQSTQVLREIDWMLERLPLSPRVCLCYDRVALAGLADTSLRVTFDDNIRWRTQALDLSRGSWGAPLLDEGGILMEIKALGAMPLWLARALSELSIAPCSFSKYGICYARHLAVPRTPAQEVAHAS